MALGEPRIDRLGRLAQLGERLPYKQEVTGSNPVPPICSLQGFSNSACGRIGEVRYMTGTNFQSLRLSRGLVELPNALMPEPLISSRPTTQWLLLIAQSGSGPRTTSGGDAGVFRQADGSESFSSIGVVPLLVSESAKRRRCRPGAGLRPVPGATAPT